MPRMLDPVEKAAWMRQAVALTPELALERYLSVPEGKRDVERDEHHCYICGAPSGSEYSRALREGMDVRLCMSCGTYENNHGKSLDRLAKCPPEGPGCKMPRVKLGFREAAENRFAAVPVEIRGVAREETHCYYCAVILDVPGKRGMRGPTLPKGAEEPPWKRGGDTRPKGKRARLCSACGGKLKKPKDLLDRLAVCPSIIRQ